MLTVRDEDARLFEAIRNGARGYLLKSIRAQQLLEMIRAVARGEAALSPAMAARVMDAFRRFDGTPPWSDSSGADGATGAASDDLTFREHEVLKLITAGLADKEIAVSLNISLYTVKSHVRSILAKLHVTNRREAAQVSRQGE
jgi:DNA-binding NarL/FixJ family response regulator